MKKLVVYIHGLGGSASESAHYSPLFPDCDVIGLEYASSVPWDAGKELRAALGRCAAGYDRVTLVANSIGAFFAMHAGIDAAVRRAYFISPVVDMEGLILGRMAATGVTEEELRIQGVVPADGGDLSWEYLSYVRAHPLRWDAPTAILYGSRDDIVPYGPVAAFAARHGAALTVMEGGEHWFHTEEQMRFLDEWITSIETLQI